MKRLIALCLACLFLCSVSACAEKKVPELAAIRGKYILAELRGLTANYQNRNLDAFFKGVSPAYAGRDAFRTAVAGVFARYATIRFTVRPSRMEIMIDEQDQSKVTFTWDAEWMTAGGASLKDGGRATLVFEPVTYLLRAIDGKNPFLAQPGETPENK